VMTAEAVVNKWENNWNPEPIPLFSKRPLDRDILQVNSVFADEFSYEDRVLASVDERPGLKEPRIMKAVRAGSYEVVRRMLSRCENLHEQDAMGETAIFEACASARVDIVALLLLCKANTRKKSKEGVTCSQLTTDRCTLGLVTKFEGGDVDRQVLMGALMQCNVVDQKRVGDACGITQDDVKAAKDLRERPAEKPAKPAERPPELGTAADLPAAAVAAEPGAASPVAAGVAPGATPKADGAGSPGSAGAAIKAAEPEAPAPERTEVGRTFQVVYKMVAVRSSPDTKAESIRAMKKGTKVTMFETDRTRMWRRVRVEVPKSDDAGEGDEMVEVDGWMLLRSEKVGLLVQEIQEEEDDEEEDDDAAG